MTPTDLLREAERRYLYDAEFHARVEHAVQAIDRDLHDRTGARLDANDRSCSTLAAAVGLLMAKVNPVTGALMGVFT